jgi:hypothetical protein
VGRVALRRRRRRSAAGGSADGSAGFFFFDEDESGFRPSLLVGTAPHIFRSFLHAALGRLLLLLHDRQTLRQTIKMERGVLRKMLWVGDFGW